MKNLKLLSSGHALTIKEADYFCIDEDSKNIYLGNSVAIYLMENASSKTTKCADLKRETNSDSCAVVLMEYLIDSQTIFLALSSGEIFVYDLYNKEAECVGTVDSGIKTAAWSPDQEFLVVLTGENTLIIMTKEYDPLSERDLCTDQYGESMPINVGWGSKQTQFHGSEGKDAAKVKKVEPKPALESDDRRSRISWREDGELFVTSVIDPKEGYRRLRIWSRSGKLQCTAEVKDGLEQSICWRPSGNLITCTRQYANRHQMIFFEKNGLQHGEFVLPFQPNTCKVAEIIWNYDSTILAMVVEELNAQPSAFVQLWTCSNYHWYLKQKLTFADTTAHSIKVHWDQESVYKLHIYCISGDYYEYTYAWDVSQSQDNEDAIVASIDNNSVLITPFEQMIVPPPLCAYSHSLPSSVDAVVFSKGSSSAFAVYMSNKTLAFFHKDSVTESLSTENCQLKLVACGGNGFKSQIKPYNFSGIYRIKFEADFKELSLCHWTWVSNNRLLLIGYPFENRKTCMLLTLNIPELATEGIQDITAMCLETIDGCVYGMCANADGSVVALQLDSGKVLSYDHETLSPWLCDNDRDLIFPLYCRTMSIIAVHEKDYVLGLTDRLSLYCNDILLLSNCTSFNLHSEFLLATTTDNSLKCYKKDWDIPALFKGKILAPSEISSQRIERGAKIVVSTPLDTKVILQMPRGNLETIHPRLLVVSSICRLLENLQFHKAFLISKLHCINLNLLYDHNPKKFLSNIDTVINQIDSPVNLNLILSSLQKEDVTETMYAASYKGRPRSGYLKAQNKVDDICKAFREALEAKNDDRYFQTIMATHAKMTQPELDKALVKIIEVKDSKDLSPSAAQKMVDEALKFLLYLVDVSELLNVALGTYNFQIAVMVAQKSQKDPKEFLPFFNEFLKYEENYRKFKIDMHLQRYKLALQNISKCEEHFDECIALIKDQRLYTDALYLFPSSSDQCKIVWKEYGNYLMGKRYYDEAGLVYSKCEEHEKALLAYKECSNWQLVLCSAERLNYSDEQIVNLCYQMSEKLKEDQRHLDSAFLLEHYVKDIEESIVTLIQGQEWNSALLLISKYRRNDITETHLKPALKEHLTDISSNLNQLYTDFNKHTERLKILRQHKRRQSEIPDLLKTNDDDLFSETSSISDVASSCAESKQFSGSILTRKSSRSKRKQKLKKYRLKEGGPDEDLALMEILSEIVAKVDNLKDNFQNSLKTFIRFNYDADVRSLQQLMTDMVEKIDAEYTVIWAPPSGHVNKSNMTYGPEETANSIAATLRNRMDAQTFRTDTELVPPTWRKNTELRLQLFQ